MSNIHDGHRARLRAMIDQIGAYNLNDINFLEHLLTYIIPRGDTNPIAHNLLNEFGSVDAIFDASYEGLINVRGVGDKTAKFLQFMSVVAYEYGKGKALKRPKVETMGKLITMLTAIMPPSPNEQFVVVKLTKDYKVVGYRIFEGTSHSYVNIDFNKIRDYLLSQNTTFCVFAHTHPDCSGEPSASDYKMFYNFTTMINSFKITLIDNLIIGKESFYSQRLNGVSSYDNYDESFNYKEANLKELRGEV